MYLKLIVLEGGTMAVGENIHVYLFKESSAKYFVVENCFALAGVTSDDQLVVTENQVSFQEAD
jgi:hypothetical protein